MNGYHINEEDPENPQVNKSCAVLEHSPSLAQVLKNMEDTDFHKSHAKNINLSHNQLVERIENYRQLFQEQRMQTFNLAKKNIRLNKTLERFLLMIKNNDIKRLHDIVKVALNAGRSLRHVIDKVR